MRWCQYRSQTREHLFKVCLEWKAQQKVLWAEVWKETRRGKSWWTIRDLLADARCSRAVLDFLATTDVGRLVPGDEAAGSEASEWELRERLEREEERRVEERAVGVEDEGEGDRERPLFLPTLAFWVSAEEA